jgi:hypothetical protein
MTKLSNSSTGLRCSKYWTKSLAFWLLTDIITGPGWRWMLVCMEVRVSWVGSAITWCSLHCSRFVLWLAACCHVYLLQGRFCGIYCRSECITGLAFGFSRLPLKATALGHVCLHWAYWTCPILNSWYWDCWNC